MAPDLSLVLYTSRYSCDRRVHVCVPSTVRVIAEKICDPVVDLFGHVKLNYFLHYSLVSYRVKCLRELKGKDTDVRIDR